MKKDGKRMAIIAMLALAALLVLAGCSSFRKAESVPISGGKTDLTDPSAPKVITSKEITAFEANFWCFDRYDEARNGAYRFAIAPNERGELCLSCAGVLEASTVIGQTVLDGVQTILDEYDLAAQNGVYSVTAGLAPPYGPCSLTAEYASGELLTFTVDGDPREPWCAALRDLFFEVFAQAGYEKFAPPAESLTMENCIIDFSEGELEYSYGFFENENGSLTFCRSVYDRVQEKVLLDEETELTDALLAVLQNTVEESGLETLLPDTEYDFFMEHGGREYFDITIDYANGRQIYVQAAGEDLPEQWPAVRDALRTALDPFFETE